jgi:DeoR/GlpR family transcriptional regulator of sugar metabolism
MNIPEYRREYILKEIEQKGSVSIVNVAEVLKVSDMTIRRDLAELEKEGLLRRTYGGAVINTHRAYEPPLALRSTQASEAKQRIGKAAAELVSDGDAVALDVGSTALAVAKNLIGRQNLTIITPSLHIANLFINQPDVRLILPGGIVRPGEASLVGSLTIQAFEGIFFDRLFLGVGAIDARAGLTEYNWEDAQIKQVMLKSAKEVVAVADSSKFGRVAFALICHFNAIQRLVTDQLPPEPLLKKLNEAGVKLVVASDGLAEENGHQRSS